MPQRIWLYILPWLLFVTLGLLVIVLRIPSPATNLLGNLGSSPPPAGGSPTPNLVTNSVLVYFSPPDAAACNTVLPFPRSINPTQNITPELVLAELLKGLQEPEASQGFTTHLPVDTKLQSVQVENGIASVTLTATPAINTLSACIQQGITAQITQTLLQLPAIKEVHVQY